MVDNVEGATVVIIIALGILTLIILFIFVKRQIMRFALRSRRGPHVPIGHDAKKAFRREIERRIEVIPKIMFEPKLLNEDDPKYILPPSENSRLLSSFYCRLRAVDDIKKLGKTDSNPPTERNYDIKDEAEITKNDKTLARHPSENLRAYLLNTLATPLNSVSQRTVHQFCDLYEHARFDPNEFTEEDYRVYSRILLKLLDAARMLKGYSNVRKSNPNNRTPVKKIITEKSSHKDSNDYQNDDSKNRLSFSNSEKSGETPV